MKEKSQKRIKLKRRAQRVLRLAKKTGLIKYGGILALPGGGFVIIGIAGAKVFKILMVLREKHKTKTNHKNKPPRKGRR